MPVAPSMSQPLPGIGNRTMVALIGALLMLQALSTDLYLASLPGLTRTFATSIATVELTLSVWVTAFGAMQLIAGPLSDRYGRRPVLNGGLGLYVAASIGCALAPTIELLIAGRFVQGVGCCAVVVVARAIVRDVYEPDAGATVLAQASSVLAIGPIFGSILGSFLEVRYGHRAAFVALALFAALLLIATLPRLAETNLQRNALATRPRFLAANYRSVALSPEFAAYTLAGCASYGGLFTFISGSSFVLVRVLGVPTEYFGFAFSFCVVGYLLGTLLCRYLLTRTDIARALRAGAALALASGVAMVALAVAGVHHWAGVLVPAFGFLLAHGINFPCSQIGSLAPFPRNAGAAAGLFGFCMMLVAALTGTLVGATHGESVYPMAFTMTGFGIALCVIVFGWVARLGSRASLAHVKFPEGEDTSV